MSEKNYTGKRVLVADDDIDLLEQLKLFLETAGFTVIAADSQAQAEQLLQETAPDLAVFDLMMENQDSGFVLAYKTKKLYPNTPVILVTAVAAETGISFHTETTQDRSWIKADAVLDKDIRYEQLMREIERLM